MELNFFHKTVLSFALLILGVGVFDAVSKNITSSYSEISSVAKKYDLVALEPISEPPVLLSQAWLKNAMVNSFVDVGSPLVDSDSVNQLIVKINNSSPAQNLYLLSFDKEKNLTNIKRDLKSIKTVAFVEPNLDIYLQQDESAETDSSAENRPEDQPEIPENAESEEPMEQENSTEDSQQESSEKLFKESFKVGLIDSGVDKTHPDLKGKKIYTKTYLSDSADKVGHGTHLAGLIFDKAPDIELYSYKFTDGKTGKLSSVIKALLEAKNDQVDLVNLSLGLAESSESLKEAIDLLRSHNVLVVAAAGNQNTDTKFYPAALNGVTAVGALNSNGVKLPNSNYGDWLDFSILGQDLYSLSPDGGHRYLSGTSQSAAIVSGLIANYLNSHTDSLDYQDFMESLEIEKEVTDSHEMGIRLSY